MFILQSESPGTAFPSLQATHPKDEWMHSGHQTNESLIEDGRLTILLCTPLHMWNPGSESCIAFHTKGDRKERKDFYHIEILDNLLL